MNRDARFSGEFPGAFIDGRLTVRERGTIHAHPARDEAPGLRVCELRRLRDLIRLAYECPPPPPRRHIRR